MKRMLCLLLMIIMISGCQTFSQPDNVDLNWTFAPMFARKLNAKPDSQLVYLNVVRFKILGRALKIYYSDRKLKDSGMVELKFNIRRNGEVVDVKVVDESSTKNQALRETAVDSVFRSSPFPKFYKIIQNDELSLRLAIDFSPDMNKKQESLESIDKAILE